MKRSVFLRSALPGAAIGLLAGGCTRREAARAVATGQELEEASIAELRSWVDARPHGARDLVEHYLARIDAVDRSGPALRAVVETNPDARAIADRLDDERRRGGARGPLHGIPILVKDNIDTGDRMQTTAGSLALVGAPARADAPVVARLRGAGAVLLGKTNLSEWANIRDRHATSGWSARGGFTKNPYVLDRSPSGSSSGSAVAVSANLAAAAIGTETVGSIISPSSVCGVVGVKPSAGLLATRGIVPISHTQDTAGPIARSVADAALLLGVLVGDSNAYRTHLDASAARGLRIGVRRGMTWPTSQIRAAFERAVASLCALGAEIVDPVEFPHEDGLDEPLLEVLLVELAADLATYLTARGNPNGLGSLADVVRFNEAHPAEELGWFGQDLLEEAMRRGGLDTTAYRDALAACRRIARGEGLDAAFARLRLDLLVAPATGASWVTDPVAGDHFTGGSARLAAVAGYPNVTVPCGDVRGLPVGLSLVAAPQAEALLLGVAFAFEASTRHRRPPRYRPTITAA